MDIPQLKLQVDSNLICLAQGGEVGVDGGDGDVVFADLHAVEEEGGVAVYTFVQLPLGAGLAEVVDVGKKVADLLAGGTDLPASVRALVLPYGDRAREDGRGLFGVVPLVLAYDLEGVLHLELAWEGDAFGPGQSGGAGYFCGLMQLGQGSSVHRLLDCYFEYLS